MICENGEINVTRSEIWLRELLSDSWTNPGQSPEKSYASENMNLTTLTSALRIQSQRIGQLNMVIGSVRACVDQMDVTTTGCETQVGREV